MATGIATRRRGFTIVELLVVLAATALLLAVAAPRYVVHLDGARELALKENLRRMREAIDRFHADQSRWPVDLQELVDRRYLRAVPVDPLTERADSWIAAPGAGADSGLADVRSGARGTGRDGSRYASW